jgi:hypothetical protein
VGRNAAAMSPIFCTSRWSSPGTRTKP